MALCSNHISGDSLNWTKNLLEQPEGNAQLSKGKSPRQPPATHDQQQQLKEGAVEGMSCPRCDSTNTKFCYYNNYNRSQPRHLCKTCKRHWTQGGTLRNVPIGGARKSKRPKTKTHPTSLADSSEAPSPLGRIPSKVQPPSPSLPATNFDNMRLSHGILPVGALSWTTYTDSSSNRSTFTHMDSGICSGNNSTSSSSSNSDGGDKYSSGSFTGSPQPLLPPLHQVTSMGFGYNEGESFLPSFESDFLFELGGETNLGLRSRQLAAGTIFSDSSANLLESSTSWNWEDLANFLSSDPKCPLKNPDLH